MPSFGKINYCINGFKVLRVYSKIFEETNLIFFEIPFEKIIKIYKIVAFKKTFILPKILIVINLKS